MPATRQDPTMRSATSQMRRNFVIVGVVSLFINALMLSGPLYMLQVYDRVLSSRSEQTLVALTILVVGLYAIMTVLDSVRAGMMARIASVFESRLSRPVFRANAMLAVYNDSSGNTVDPVRDLDQCRNFLSSSGPLAMFDLPWLPVYLTLVYLIHPYLGLLGTAGAAVLVVVMLVNDRMSRQPVLKASAEISARSAIAESARNNPGATLGMGMMSNLAHGWDQRTDVLLASQTSAADRSGAFRAISKSTRMVLQSGVLGLGAYLALLDQISPGMMIAASIITARAVAPVEQTIGSWRGLVATRQALKRLAAVLDLTTAKPVSAKLPTPEKSLTVHSLYSGPSRDSVVLRGVSFKLKAGDGLGVIGTSGSGKTTLGRAILGIWPTISGSIRLDGATIDQWDPAVIGASVGFLPQDVGLFDGTIAENIARFTPNASTESVVRAAVLAGVHDLITSMPDGYSTEIGEGKIQLSAGQRQRIGLARAIYGDPFLVILDEPNANLDADGDALLARAILSVRNRGGIVIVVAHRPSAISTVDQLLVMKDGRQQEYGPKKDVLARIAKNAQQLNSAVGLKVAIND